MKVPEGTDEATSIFAIEEYENQAALDAHMGSEIVQTLLPDLEREDHHKHLLHRDMIASHEIHTFPSSISYSRPSTAKCKYPFIVFAGFTFRPRQAATVFPRLKELMHYYQESEPEIPSYTVMEDKEANQLRTVEVYETKDYLHDVHVKSDAVRKNGEQNGNLRVEGAARAVKCRKVAGWLYRG